MCDVPLVFPSKKTEGTTKASERARQNPRKHNKILPDDARSLKTENRQLTVVDVKYNDNITSFDHHILLGLS